MRRIPGDGVDLILGAAGRGWDDRGFSWFEATRRCAYLTPTAALASVPQGSGDAPTVGEVDAHAKWRGANAGGVWDAAPGGSPIGRPTRKPRSGIRLAGHLLVDGLEAGSGRAYRVAYNGYVLAVRKQHGADYTACRCVRTSSAS